MSNIYIQEPPTNGKVLLITSVGDIDIELWSKETPKACRNFIQLCLEHYYDETIFHRIVKGFCVQGGDPTGTGYGGESIYGKKFKDEFHQRLKFNRRGLVAMANSGPHDNGSQFFFTLDRVDELNGKHTIFGKITGNTIYNMLKMADLEVDDNDHPYYPPKIKRTEVLSNPFDDIEPRNLKHKKEEATAVKKPKVKGTKNFSLLSFGEEAEEDEEEVKSASKGLKMKSSHDILDDPTLSKESVKTEQEPLKDSAKITDEVRQKLKKRPVDDDEEDDDEDSDEETKNNSRKSEQLREESKKLLKEIKESRKKPRKTSESKDDKQKTKDHLSEVVADFRAERQDYMAKNRGSIKAKGDGRSEQTFSLLADFQAKLDEEGGEGGEGEEESDNIEADDDIGWMTHALKCDGAAAGQKVKDANVQDEDTYEIFDPRNPINKRRREASKETNKSRKRR